MAPYAWHAPTCTRPRPGPEPTLTVVLIFTPVTRLPDPHTWQACGALCATCSADAMAHSAVARARAIPAAIAALRAHEDCAPVQRRACALLALLSGPHEKLAREVVSPSPPYKNNPRKYNQTHK